MAINDFDRLAVHIKAINDLIDRSLDPDFLDTVCDEMDLLKENAEARLEVMDEFCEPLEGGK